MNLVKMSEKDFDNYLNIAIPEYADDKIKAGTWKKSDAIHLATESYANLLPKGLHTPNNFLFSIMTSSSIEPIGMIWVKSTNKKLFIYDFMINEEYRGKGYGKKSLISLDNWASEHQFEEIGLHVFAHNQSAHQLYKKMGYVETDITMVRKIE